MPPTLIRPRPPGSAPTRQKYAKPASCTGCPLDERGTGFVPPEGPIAQLLFVGEAPGFDEAQVGRPFIGAAGSMFTRLLRLAGIERESVRVGNSIQCAPPKLWFDARAPWYHGALQHCRQYTQPLLDEGCPVIVPVGATAIRRVLGVHGKHTGPEAFHGTVTTLPSGQLVVPTFHPSHLQRGAANLTGTVVWDLQRALDIAINGWQPDLMVLVEDPPLDWLDLWIDQLEAAVQADPYGTWCTIDIETPDTRGKDENELGEDDQSYQIQRVNVAAHPDEGITFPYVGPYIARAQRILALLQVAVMANGDYDKPRLQAAGHPIPPIVHDTMWMWKMLQSDLPGALGFYAPFYSKFQLDGWLGAWKHLSATRPVTYAAIDGPQELRCAFGMAADLVASGQWGAYERHQRRFDQYVLKPCSAVGVPVDRERLELFRADLSTKARRLLHQLQGYVPEALRPLTPKDGLTRPPEKEAIHTKGRNVTKKGVPKKEQGDALKQELYAQASVVVEKLVWRLIKVCVTCGEQEVTVKHRCADRALTPEVLLREATVRRWFWQEPFNPDSPPQILAYLKHKGHMVGRSKTSDESTDKKTLEANWTKTQDPFYRALLDYRAIKKVLSTYVEGTLKRLDAEDRLHPHFCLTGDHEVLTPTGWVRLDCLSDTARVMQWQEGKLTFRPVQGVTRVPNYAGDIVYLDGARLAVLMTPNHRVPITVSRTRPYTYKEVTAETLPAEGKIPLTGTLEGFEPCSDWMRLAVAIQADGHWEVRQKRVRFHLSRLRKQRRLELLLDRCGVEYTKRPSRTWQTYTIRQDAVMGALVLLDWPRKVFKLDRLWSLTTEGRREFLRETLEWDGHKRPSGWYRVYQTTVRENAEIVQTVAHTVGWSATIRTDPPGEQSVQPRHSVSWSERLSHAKLARLRIRTRTHITAGVYCVTVPSGFFLVRYLNRISVTGNTFKPSTQRLSATAPNIQNVVADRGGKEAMASGFRNCIVAREDEPEATEEFRRRWIS